MGSLKSKSPSPIANEMQIQDLQLKFTNGWFRDTSKAASGHITRWQEGFLAIPTKSKLVTTSQRPIVVMTPKEPLTYERLRERNIHGKNVSFIFHMNLKISAWI